MPKQFNHKDYQEMEFNDDPLTRSLEDSLNFSIKWYNMFYNGSNARNHFFEQLFFLNGNGYQWLNGRLVCYSESTDKEIIDSRKFSWKHKCKDYKKDIIELEKELIECQSKEEDSYVKYVKRRLVKLRKKVEVFNPFYETDKGDNPVTRLPDNIGSWNTITAIPTDVKDDYLLGAIEAVDFYLNRFYMKYKQLDFQELIKLQKFLITKFGDRIDGLGYVPVVYTTNMTADELNIHNEWDCESVLRENTTVYIAERDTSVNDASETHVMVKKGEKVYVTKDSVTTDNNEYLDTLDFKNQKIINFVKI